MTTETPRHEYEQLMEDFSQQLVKAEAHPVGARQRRWGAVGALAAASIAAAAFLTLGGLGGSGRLDVVAQAKAALAPAEQIVHLVTTSHMEMRGGAQAEVIGREAEASKPRISERWSASNPLRWRVASTAPTFTSHGTLAGRVEQSYGNGTEELYVQALNTLNVRSGVSEASASSLPAGPLGTDPVARIHAMLDAGQLHDAGMGTVDGHTVRRLVGQEAGPPLPSVHSPWPVEYDVDPETYAPVRLTIEQIGVSFPENTGTPTQIVDVNTYERLPLNESTIAQLSIHPAGSPTVERHEANEPQGSSAAVSHSKRPARSATKPQ
jgi:hypothetical protein